MQKGSRLCAFCFLFLNIFENYRKALRKESKWEKVRNSYNHECSPSKAWDTVASLLLPECLASYRKWRGNWLAKEHIRAQFSSYFQKRVICRIGSGTGKLRNFLWAKYSVLFPFLPFKPLQLSRRLSVSVCPAAVLFFNSSLLPQPLPALCTLSDRCHKETLPVPLGHKDDHRPLFCILHQVYCAPCSH